MAQWPLNLSCDKSFADKKINPKTENRKITPKKEMNDSEEKTCNDNTKQPILVVDLVRLILARLSLVDFHRARCVSSTWYIASKSVTGVTNPTTPWIILFPNKHTEDNNNVSCKLYDPHENKTYIIRDIEFDMAKSRCLASSGSWFLMLDHRTDFHLLNLFARERILLPSLESMDERCMKFKRINDSYGNHIRIEKAVLWVDDKSRDYFTFIFWNFCCFVAYHHKNEDNNNSWKVLQPIKHQGCVDMVFKERALSSDNLPVFLVLCGFHSPHLSFMELFILPNTSLVFSDNVTGSIVCKTVLLEVEARIVVQDCSRSAFADCLMSVSLEALFPLHGGFDKVFQAKGVCLFGCSWLVAALVELLSSPLSPSLILSVVFVSFRLCSISLLVDAFVYPALGCHVVSSVGRG